MSNVAYAAYFLRDLESRSESWEQAIGRYHSFSPALNARYSARVQAVWAKEQVTAANLVIREDFPPTQDQQTQPPTAAVAAAGLRLSSFNEESPVSENGLTTASIDGSPQF